MIKNSILFIIIIYGCIPLQSTNADIINYKEKESTDIFIQYYPAFTQEKHSLEWISIHENVYEDFFQKIDTTIEDINFTVKGWGNYYSPKKVRDHLGINITDTSTLNQWRQYHEKNNIQIAYIDSIGNQDIRGYNYSKCWSRRVFERCTVNDVSDTIYNLDVLCNYYYIENKDTAYWYLADSNQNILRRERIKQSFEKSVKRCKVLYPHRKPIEVDLSLLENY